MFQANVALKNNCFYSSNRKTGMQVQLFQLNIRLSNGVFWLLGLCKSLFDTSYKVSKFLVVIILIGVVLAYCWLSLIPIKVPKYHFYYDFLKQ